MSDKPRTRLFVAGETVFRRVQPAKDYADASIETVRSAP